MIQFFETRMGQKFFNADMPALIKEVKGLREEQQETNRLLKQLLVQMEKETSPEANEEKAAFTIPEAVERAKKTGQWHVVPHESASVLVRFWHNGQSEEEFPDETELDLVAEDKIAELTDLWNSLAAEMESAPDKIESVETCDCIIR